MKLKKDNEIIEFMRKCLFKKIEHQFTLIRDKDILKTIESADDDTILCLTIELRDDSFARIKEIELIDAVSFEEIWV